ncbi:hypothetical protein EIP86_000269 [Pleurotus ostreatoroseus]|nr:hypothetical protein EIP86_000269 [Pleurotus ostreatoroseus]
MTLKCSKSEEEREDSEGGCMFSTMDGAVIREEGEENVSIAAASCIVARPPSPTLPLMPLHHSNQQQQPHQGLITQAVLADVLKGGTWVGSGSCVCESPLFQKVDAQIANSVPAITVSLQAPILNVHTQHSAQTQTQAESVNAQPQMSDMRPASVFAVTADLPKGTPTSHNAPLPPQTTPTSTSLTKPINHTAQHAHSPPIPSLLNPHITHPPPPSTPRLPPTPHWRRDPTERRVEPKLWTAMVHGKAARIRAMWRASLREEGREGKEEGREQEKTRGVPKKDKAQRKAKHPYAGPGPVRVPDLTVFRAHSAPPSLPSLTKTATAALPARLRGGAESASTSASVSAFGSTSASTSPPGLGLPTPRIPATATTPATTPRSDAPVRAQTPSGPQTPALTQNTHTPPAARRNAYTAELLRGAHRRAHAPLAAGSLLRHLGLGYRVPAPPPPPPPPRPLVIIFADSVSVVQQPATRPETNDVAAGIRPAGVPDATVDTPYPEPKPDKAEEDVSMKVDDAEEQEQEGNDRGEGEETEEGELGDLMYIDDEEEEGEVKEDEDQGQELNAAAVFVREACPSPSPPSSPTLRASSPGHTLTPDTIDIDMDSETEVETEVEVDELPDEVFTDSEADPAHAVPAYRARPKAPPRPRKRKRSLEENIPPVVRRGKGSAKHAARAAAVATPAPRTPSSSAAACRPAVAQAHPQTQTQTQPLVPPPRPVTRRAVLPRDHVFVPRTSTIRNYVPDQSKAVAKARQHAVRESRDAIKRPAKDSLFSAPVQNQGQGEGSSSARRALPESSNLAGSIVDDWRAELQRFFAFLQALDEGTGVAGAGRHPQQSQKAQKELLTSAQRVVGELEDNRNLLNVALIANRPWVEVRKQCVALVEGGQGWARRADAAFVQGTRDVLKRVLAVIQVFEERVRAERARLAKL